MGRKRSACLYIDGKLLKTAKQMGLNISKVSENALIEAVRRLNDPKDGNALDSTARSRVWGRGRDLNPGARLHRPVGYQATSPRPLFPLLGYCTA